MSRNWCSRSLHFSPLFSLLFFLPQQEGLSSDGHAPDLEIASGITIIGS